jgi:uroporphyrinogen decarboxylase
MNSLERFLKAIKREETDRVPKMELGIDDSVIAEIMPGKSTLDFYEEIDLDAIVVWEDIDFKEVSPHIKRDHFGILRDFRDMHGPSWPYPIKPLIGENDDPEKYLDNYIPPDPDDPKRLKSLREAIKRFRGKKAVIFGMFNSFLYPALFRGFDKFLMDYILNPEFVKRLSGMIVDYYIKLEKNAIECGADAIVDGDDYCSKTGPLISDKHFQEFILPGLKKAIDIAKNNNVPYIKHCDGYVWPLLDTLVNTGIDAINPIEPAAGMDIGKVKRTFGDRVTIIGNVDCSHLLTFGSTEDVKKATLECIKAASPGGGHILSSSNVIHCGVPARNFLAMLEAANKYGKYPLSLLPHK